MKKYNIVLATDKNYINYLEVVLKSLIHHNENVSVYVLNTGDIDNEWLGRLAPYFERKNSSLELVTLNKNILNDFGDNGYISKSTYLRYYISHLFSLSSSPYWIYLDCDIVVNGNITEPFDYIDFNSCSVAAIEDSYVKSLKNHPFVFDNYFNAGVIYFHTHKFNQNDSDNLVKLTTDLRKVLIFGDQDVLNIYFKDKWVNLDKKYNYQSRNVVDDLRNGVASNYIPHIFHFTGGTKPLSNVDYNSLYFNRIANLFRFYHQLDWETLCKLPNGTIQLKVYSQN